MSTWDNLREGDEFYNVRCGIGKVVRVIKPVSRGYQRKRDWRLLVDYGRFRRWHLFADVEEAYETQVHTH